jgi:hypothetical protein
MNTNPRNGTPTVAKEVPDTSTYQHGICDNKISYSDARCKIGVFRSEKWEGVLLELKTVDVY